MLIAPFLLAETATVQPHLGRSARGPVYGAAYSINALFEPSRKLVENERGEEVTCEAVIICGADATLKVPDWVTYNGVSYQVAWVEQVKIRGQVHHIEAALVSMGGAM